MTRTVVTFGTYDLFHIGHLNLLRRARELGDRLVVGVSTDKLTFSKKKNYPTYGENDRLNIVRGMRYVDDVFAEASLERKRDYLLQHSADVLVMGDDWLGKFDEFSDICEVVYLPRTPGISTTLVRETIANTRPRSRST